MSLESGIVYAGFVLPGWLIKVVSIFFFNLQSVCFGWGFNLDLS